MPIYLPVDRFMGLSRRFVAAVVATAGVAFIAGCTSTDGGDMYTYDCERRYTVASTQDGSLAAALAQQAAVNHAYHQCIERKAIRAGR